MSELNGRVAIVTGAAQGIGRAVALRLAHDGAALTLFDVNGDGLAETARLLGGDGARCRAVVGDVTVPEQVHAMVDGTAAAHGGIDCLVNVAGISRTERFLDLPVEQWRRTLEVNLTGTFLTTQAVGRHMTERRQGRIVNIASIAGKTGAELLADYSASKAGVISLTQSASRALAPAGVTVNAVCPGLVWTPMWRESAAWMLEHLPQFSGRDLTPEQVFARTVRATAPLRRPTTPEEVAGTVAFLLSDAASSMTGQAINVDSGIELH